MAEVKRSALVLHKTEVKGLDTLRARAAFILVLAELETSTSETKLLHEDTLIADSDLEREGLARDIETRWSGLRKLNDLGPGNVVSLDEARVVRVPAATVLLVEVGERGVRRDPAIKDNRACVLGFRARTAVGWSSKGH